MTLPYQTTPSLLEMLIDPLAAIRRAIIAPQLPGFFEPMSIHLATLGELLYGDRNDYQLMERLETLRRQEDDIDEELRDPDRGGCAYCYIVGERSIPTARSLVPQSELRFGDEGQLDST